MILELKQLGASLRQHMEKELLMELEGPLSVLSGKQFYKTVLL